MPRDLFVWGAGLTPAARSLPQILFPPAIAFLIPTIGARAHMPEALRSLLQLPWYIQSAVSLLLLSGGHTLVGVWLRYRDRRRFGPNVVAVPKLKSRWPLNADFIPFLLDSMENDYSTEGWTYFLEEYGNTANLALLGGDLVVTSEPEHIKSLLSTDFTSYEKGQTFRDKMFSVFGNGLLTSDGEMWKFHRNMTRPYFTRDRLSHVDMLVQNADAAISKIILRLAEPPRSNVPVAVDFQELAQRFTLDSSTEFLFGKNFRSLDSPLPYPHSPTPQNDNVTFSTAFGRVQELVMVRFSLDMLWPWMELWWDRTGDDMRVINSYIQPILKEKLAEKHKDSRVPSKGPVKEAQTLLDHLVQTTDDESLIKDETLTMLLAGRDGTAAVLTFTVYLLAMDSGVLAKLRDEILTQVGSSKHPTLDDFKEMKYLRSVINETLRLFPPFPISERTSVRSTVLKSTGGKAFYIPAGTNVTYSVMHMHRRKDLWGPDAEAFDPERWLDERLQKYLTPNPSIFLPFSTGPRVCIGQQLAYITISSFLVRLLQRFESIELVPEAHPVGTLPPAKWKDAPGRKAYERVWPKLNLGTVCNGGLWVHMKEAKEFMEEL